MRMFCASMIHETNTFSPIQTDLQSFADVALYLPSTGQGRELVEQPFEGVNIGMLARSRGHSVIDGVMASAEPSAPLRRRDYEHLREEILDGLRAAQPVDAVVLFLHGAQVAHGYADCEGDLIERIRTLAGDAVPIAVEIDPHANVTERMTRNATILVSSQEYPHVDFEDRAVHLLELLERTVAGEIDPRIAFVRVPMFGSFYTTRQPMRDFVDSVLARQGRAGILSVSLIHGFAWADIPDAGAGVVVVANGNAQLAAQLAAQVADEFFALRRQIVVEQVGADLALERALAAPRGPAVIADTTDNPGGGAPGDSTFLLRGLLERKVTNAAVGMLWDPVAVELASIAGEGAQLPLRIGGKACPLSGQPLDVLATVVRLRDDAVQNAQGRMAPLGRAAALRVDGVEIVINSLRQQVFDPACFTAFGIEPRDKRVVVVKSHQHFFQTFGPFAGSVIYACPPGVVQRDFTALPYRHITRPVWPIDVPPFHVFGRTWT
ncbi:MAG TPA: M81 family metallopeptidase [Steroidobacteraceae bacterium]|nr:M81 family metallopeptidase [Steroidobacteraceae bacterium]